ncbi:hypothetical protein SK128_004825 [Halocaridina rubra]|uniref:Uncharacterized protein n=1 Tax=Halocaridina rubra TaxID=373956 RepID=A0AAN8X4X9_HALRR
MYNIRIGVVFFSLLLTITSSAEFDDPYNYDYSYGDYSYVYDTDTAGSLPHRAVALPGMLQSENRVAEPELLFDHGRAQEFNGDILPLCCPEGSVFDLDRNCTSSPASWDWRPSLHGAPDAQFYFRGFPQ